MFVNTYTDALDTIEKWAADKLQDCDDDDDYAAHFALKELLEMIEEMRHA